MCLVHARGVERVEDDVLVVSIDRLTYVLRLAAGDGSRRTLNRLGSRSQLRGRGRRDASVPLIGRPPAPAPRGPANVTRVPAGMIAAAANHSSGVAPAEHPYVAKAIASSVTRWMTKAIVREMRAFRAKEGAGPSSLLSTRSREVARLPCCRGKPGSSRGSHVGGRTDVVERLEFGEQQGAYHTSAGHLRSCSRGYEPVTARAGCLCPECGRASCALDPARIGKL